MHAIPEDCDRQRFSGREFAHDRSCAALNGAPDICTCGAICRFAAAEVAALETWTSLEASADLA